MPLLSNARRTMRINLEKIRDGKNPGLIVIGTLTANQLININAIRTAEEMPPIVEEVVFKGKHLYESRIDGDGYTIDDVLDQIVSAMDPTSVIVETLKMTGMENPNPRLDRYGNQVYDRVVFECTSRYPRPELYSVMPKGDGIKPIK
jgi:hypothetical protein